MKFVVEIQSRPPVVKGGKCGSEVSNLTTLPDVKGGE